MSGPYPVSQPTQPYERKRWDFEFKEGEGRVRSLTDVFEALLYSSFELSLDPLREVAVLYVHYPLPGTNPGVAPPPQHGPSE